MNKTQSEIFIMLRMNEIYILTIYVKNILQHS